MEFGYTLNVSGRFYRKEEAGHLSKTPKERELVVNTASVSAISRWRLEFQAVPS